MNTLYVTQELRPLRICFVVDKSKKSILKAVAINTTLWGGVYNPIISFKKTDKFNIKRNLGLINEFDPDYILDLSGGMPDVIKNQISHPVLKQEDFFFSDATDINKGYRIGLRAYAAFLDEIPESKLTDETKDRLCSVRSPKGEFNLFYAVRFGLLDKNISPDLVEFTKNKLQLKEKTLNFDQYSKTTDSDLVGPIAITTSQLRPFRGGGGFSSSLIYIGSCKNNEDLIEYWNLRASGRDVFFLPTQNYESFMDSLRDFIDGSRVDERFNRIDLDLQISPSLIKDTKKFEFIADWIKTSLGTNPPRRMWLANWGRRNKRVSPDINCITPIYSREKLAVSYSKDEVTPFTASSPKFVDDFFHKDNAWAIGLSFIGFYENDYTIDLPNQEGMQDLAKRELIFGGWGRVRISDQGLVFYPDSKDDTITLSPVSVQSVVDTIFDKIGQKRKLSTPGIFSNKILQMMGGLESCRVFKIKGVREALSSMNKDEGEVIVGGKKLRGEVSKARPMLGSAIRDIIKNTSEDGFGSKNWIPDLYKDLILYAGQAKPLTPEIVFDYLVNKKLISPGRKFKCRSCSCEEWYKIGSFSETFKCVHCGFTQDIPRIDDANWYYQTEGLVAISDEGRGSLPVILSLWRLSHQSRMGNNHFVTSFELGSKTNPNFDKELDYFFFTVDSYSQNIEVVLGEARNYIDFKLKDVKKTLSVAKMFKNKPFIAFTTLKDKFSNKEITLFKGIMKQGYYVLPFTRLDLDPYDLFDRFDSLKNKYAVTLEDLSINLCTLNLNLTEGGVYGLVELETKKRIDKMVEWMDKKRKQIDEKATSNK